jgi:CelD/BcsL family acetyltransferase involved in cellulose biosynthesis
MKDAAVTGEWIPVGSYANLGSDWQTLEQGTDSPPFLAWHWVSTWLARLPPKITPYVFRARAGDALIALGIFVATPNRGLTRLFGNRTIYALETGDDELDEITIEYAGLLASEANLVAAYGALFGALQHTDRAWRSVDFSGTTHAEAMRAALPSDLSAFASRESASYRVDLAALRAENAEYLPKLSKSTRSGLRQTRRAYEKLGELRIDAATSADEAIEWLDRLRVLHERHWQAKGARGSFASAFFDAFHRDLLRIGVPAGFTEILRVRAGEAVVGYMYMLVWKNRAYFYNSGLDYTLLGKQDRPGFLANLLAIERYLALGFDVYDFLPGIGEYKRMMSTMSHTVQWIRIQPRGWRLSLERALQAIRGRKSAGASANADD